MIREATFLDIPAVFELCKKAYAESSNHQRLYAWDEEKAISSLKIFILCNGATVLIDEKGGVIRGFLIAELTAPLGGVDIIATDVAFYVLPEHRGSLTAFRLIKKYESWAKKNGAKHIELGVSSGVVHEKTLSLYAFLGYRPLSVTYTKEV